VDDTHLRACVRYVERNPVRARLVARAEDWPHSSARAHLSGQDDALVTARPLLSLASDLRAFLADAASDSLSAAFGYHERTGRPMGSDGFIDQLEAATRRRLHKLAPGRKPKPQAPAAE
jgi:putative transposase